MNDMFIPIKASVEMEIPFHDVDTMEIVWHGHYARYFEIARCALLEKIDYNYPQMRNSGYAWPIVDLRIKYIKPCRFQQRITVEAELVEYENRLKMAFTIYDTKTRDRLIKGSAIQVAVDTHTNEMCYVSPPVLIDKLKLYQARNP